jgi:hypothetical protein
MPSLGFRVEGIGIRNVQLGALSLGLNLSSIPYHLFPIFSACAQAAYNLRTTRRAWHVPIHSLLQTAFRSVHKPRKQAPAFTQVYQFLYTVYLQYYTTIQSVKGYLYTSSTPLIYTIQKANKGV